MPLVQSKRRSCISDDPRLEVRLRHRRGYVLVRLRRIEVCVAGVLAKLVNNCALILWVDSSCAARSSLTRSIHCCDLARERRCAPLRRSAHAPKLGLPAHESPRRGVARLLLRLLLPLLVALRKPANALP